jgi:hypothetical protein
MQKKVDCLSFLILLVGILFISGCATQNAGGANAPAASQPAQGTGKAQGISFSPPAELPIAYVGTPFTYSFSATGGTAPYRFTTKLDRVKYSGSVRVFIEGLSVDSAGQLTLTAKAGNEGEYVLNVCVNDNVCKDVTFFIMSDTVKTKGSGKVTSSLMWDPHASVYVRGKGDTAKDIIEGRESLISLSEISTVNLNANLPPKDSNPGSPYSMGSSGGGTIRLEMTATSMNILQSVTGDLPCGTPKKDGTVNGLNMDSFQAVGQTNLGLNIVNDGTADKVVDISMTGRSGISADSKNYDSAGTNVHVFLGSTSFTFMAQSMGKDVVAAGNEITDSKVVRVVVKPGSHVLNIGYVQPEFEGGLRLTGAGCPVHLGIRSEVTVTVADAILSDGKLPTDEITTQTSGSKTFSSIHKIE